jgi:hypothetical protein
MIEQALAGIRFNVSCTSDMVELPSADIIFPTRNNFLNIFQDFFFRSKEHLWKFWSAPDFSLMVGGPI